MADIWPLARVLTVICRDLLPCASRVFQGCAAPAGPPSLALAPQGLHGARGSHGRRSAATLLAATSVAALTAALGSSIALCEPAKDGGLDASAIKTAVFDLWKRLEEQLHRIEATLPPDTHLPPIPEPEVEFSRGGDVQVSFALPQDLDIPGAVRTLRRQLRSPAFASLEEGSLGSALSESSTSGPDGRATQFVRRSTGLGGLSVDVLEPHDPSQPARFHFRGRPTRRDLALMSVALQAAMQPRRRGPVDEFRDLGQLFEGTPFGRPFEGMTDPFLDHLQEFIQGFERIGEMWQLDGEERGGWPGERDTQPTPLQRPKRLDDWGRGRAGGFEPGQLEGREGAPTEQELEQQRKQRQIEAAKQKLEKHGAQVFVPDPNENIDWGILAGYEEQKRQIEDTVLLALLHPEVYNEIAKGTRRQFASNRPRAVLFEGPPGTGKTTSARIIASQAAVPLVYIPLEAVVSKWYGESEKMLADMLKTCESFPDGCIIFLDELDALATSRSTEMHEATRRVLGVLLRHLDGFDSTNKRTVVIGATNRKQDLDPALISRFSTSIHFGVPDEKCRAEILRQYARHLSDAELLVLAGATPGMAGRDLKDICEQAERRWASKMEKERGRLSAIAWCLLRLVVCM